MGDRMTEPLMSIAARENGALRLLVVDDDEFDRLAVRRLLKTSDLRTTVDEAATLEETLEHLSVGSYDCVLLDYYIPGVDGHALIRAISEAAPDIPVVILTGRGDENMAVELMKAGAADYLPKASLTLERLASSLRHAMEISRAAARRRDAERTMRESLELEHEARARAEHAKRLRDEVLAIVAHDLRNPLHTILASSSAMLDLPLSAEERTRQLEVIRRSAKTMNVLISDLLDVTSIELGNLSIRREQLAIGEVLEHTAETFDRRAHERGIALECDVPAALPSVSGDRGRLAQVLSNILANALKFTPEGGRIRLRAVPVAGAVEIAVENSGAGIAPEYLPHVFDRFWRADQSARASAGLGLAIAKGIVDAHGGRIWVESTPGETTTFYFTVPAAGSAPES
jgi:signal transduction histidine kinase